MPTKSFRTLSAEFSGHGSLYPTTRPTQQLGGICFEYIPADLTMQILPIAVCLHQTCPHQLLDVMRDRCLRYGKFFPKFLAGALPLAGNDLQHLHAPGIRQRLGDELELLVGQDRPVGCGLFHSSMVIELSNGCQDPLSASYMPSSD